MAVPTVRFRDEHTIPQLGLGVYKIDDRVATATVLTALQAGYRHIDTATLYGNERGVGEAVRSCGLPREDIFITTKVWDTDHGYESTLRACRVSLDKLGLDHVDLYLIHWPVPSQDRYVETWRALQKLRSDGLATSIGVSNFHPHHLERLRNESGELPVVNQIELHPWLPQRAVREYHQANGIVTEAWSPLARGRLLADDTLARIGARHGKSPAQVVIRWHLQLGTVVIPKSVTPARIRENIDVFDFSLDSADLAAIAALETGQRTGQDPDQHG